MTLELHSVAVEVAPDGDKYYVHLFLAGPPLRLRADRLARAAIKELRASEEA
ncbi:MAG: hypothetical protein HY246_06775 [Proteobacteria bacterium]|nr:hypothetical protein [Pseudomonadota bacterium]